MGIFEAIILGIVEGLTEFLPISSTGHMILAAKLLGLDQESAAVKCFEVVIQLGSILAVLFIYSEKLRNSLNLWLKLALGFLPTAIIGFLLYKFIKDAFNETIVAYMLILYGVIFIIVELFLRRNAGKMALTDEIEKITFKQAFLIGISQCLAMIPGTSRSGVTIIAGLLCGLSRSAAASFSFLLAIPTMAAATLYDTYKNHEIFAHNSDLIPVFLLGGVVAFFVAFVTIKIFLKFVSKFDYIPFGIYRILVGILFLTLF